jgi:FMN reductase [NAD(P)H]
VTAPRDLLAARFGHVPFEPPAEVAPGLAALLNRRVTRRYRPDAVPEPLLATVLAAAQSAPSKSDLQQYAIVVLQDPVKIRAIAGWIGTMPWIADAPVFLLFCADLRRGRRICEMHQREHANDSMDSFLNASVDAAAAMAFCVMAADAAGLGTCPISYVRNHLEKVAPLVSLPRGVFPVAGLTLGWPEARNEPSPRLPPSVVVHRERYDDAALESTLRDYDQLRPPAAPRYPEVFGPERERWSANASRQLAVPERAGFRTWLRWHGFSLE